MDGCEVDEGDGQVDVRIQGNVIEEGKGCRKKRCEKKTTQATQKEAGNCLAAYLPTYL